MYTSADWLSGRSSPRLVATLADYLQDVAQVGGGWGAGRSTTGGERYRSAPHLGCWSGPPLALAWPLVPWVLTPAAGLAYHLTSIKGGHDMTWRGVCGVV